MEKMASMSLVFDLLPVVDNFQRAIASIPGNLGGLTWIHGVILIERQMKALLESRGVTPIEAIGKPFDPHYHEAVSERETDEAAPNTVVAEYQQGYVMHGYVIRPALVEVAKAPAAPAQAEESAPSDVTETDTSDGEEISDEAQEQNVGP
jgi:molecular chaperone GrpE